MRIENEKIIGIVEPINPLEQNQEIRNRIQNEIRIAKEVLAKVAKVINSRPTFECMVEGHTDNLPYSSNSVLLDNWDLSVKRSTAIIRVLTTDLGVKPSQLIAAGRSQYIPLVDNSTAENRATNRRTKILILPKIDQFYDMIESEMKNLSEE